MRIEFDPTNPDEAAAVRAMLTAMHREPTYVQMVGRGMRLATTTNGEALTEEDARAARFDAEMAEGLANDEELGLNGPDTDSDGTPWDARIHSTPPTTNKDGTWRAKRGVKAEEIAAVRAERDTERESAPTNETNAPVGEQSAPPAPPTPTGQSEAPLVPDVSTVTEAEKSTEQTVSGSAPVPPAPLSATTTTVEASTHGSGAPISPSFLDVMKAITAAQKDGKIDTAKVKELCAAVGAGESTMGLNGPDNGDKRGAFMALLDGECAQ